MGDSPKVLPKAVPKAVPQDPGKPGPGEPIPESYHQFADKVGLIPNLRLSDNLAQAAAAGVGTLVGAVAGLVVARDAQGVVIGGLLGFIAGGVLSGAVLMVVGLLRK